LGVQAVEAKGAGRRLKLDEESWILTATACLRWFQLLRNVPKPIFHAPVEKSLVVTVLLKAVAKRVVSLR
jgi:hypothetical protein